MNLSASDCSGPDSNTPQPNPNSATINSKQNKVGDTGKGANKVAGACYNQTQGPSPLIVKSTLTWAGGATIRNTSTKIPLSGVNNGPPGLGGTGTAAHSYFGSASMQLLLTADSINNYGQVCGDGMAGSVSEFDFDPTMSTLTLGQTGS